jgi:AcrR family transcriptional regulator
VVTRAHPAPDPTGPATPPAPAPGDAGAAAPAHDSGASAPSNPTGAPQYVPPRVANRRAILEAARKLIAAHGFGGFTSADLARHAGVSRRTVFNHFPSVEEAILAALSQELMDRADAWVEQVGPPGVRFATLAEAFDAFAASVPQLAFNPTVELVSGALEGDQNAARVGLAWRTSVLTAVCAKVSEGVCARMDNPDRLAVEVMAKTIMGAWSTAFEYWLFETGGNTDDAGQALLLELTEAAIAQVRAGYSA